MPNTPLLDTIHYPSDLRKLEKKQLTQLALVVDTMMLMQFLLQADIWERAWE